MADIIVFTTTPMPDKDYTAAMIIEWGINDAWKDSQYVMYHPFYHKMYGTGFINVGYGHRTEKLPPYRRQIILLPTQVTREKAIDHCMKHEGLLVVRGSPMHRFYERCIGGIPG